MNFATESASTAVQTALLQAALPLTVESAHDIAVETLQPFGVPMYQFEEWFTQRGPDFVARINQIGAQRAA